MASNIPQRKRAASNHDPLSENDVLMLLENIPAEFTRDKMLIELGVNTGPRVNEMAGLRVDKVDYSDSSITFWDDKHNPHEGNRKLGTYRKTGEGRWRKVYVNYRIMAKLKQYQKKNVPKDAALFWDVSWITLERVVQRWTSQILHNKRSWHALRDTFVTLGRKKRKSMEYMMSQTGDTAAVVLKNYSKPLKDDIKAEAEIPIY